MIRFIVASFFLFFYVCSYPFTSKFLSIDTNSLEYRAIMDPDAFPLEKSALLASGVDEETLSNYLSVISNFEASIKVDKPVAESLLSREIFLQMHKKILKTYDESETTLEAVIGSGRYNCLSSTLMYNSLLEDFGIKGSGVILPSHAYTMLEIGGREIDVENTSPYGYDIGTNMEAQENFKKLTGFSYSHDPEITEVVGKRGLLAYTYANMSYFDFKKGNIYESFQNALKSWAVYPEGKYIYSNVSAAYSAYSMYLTDTKKDYILALSVLEEAVSNIPQKGAFLTNYFYVLDKYLNSLVDLNSYDEAFNVMEKAFDFAGRNESVFDNLYTRILYRLINHDADFNKAYDFGKKALEENPKNENIQSLMINGLNLYSQKLVKDWQEYPKGEDFLLKWYALMKNEYFDSILENYYNLTGLKFNEYKDPDRGIEVLIKGLVFFPGSKLLKNNIVYIAGNAANGFFGTQDYSRAIFYLKTGLKADPGNVSLKSNLNTAYRIYTSDEIEAKNYSKALAIAEEGLLSFPGDQKLIYYRDYLKKRIK